MNRMGNFKLWLFLILGTSCVGQRDFGRDPEVPLVFGGMCPSKDVCTCDLDPSGRMEVTCLRGGMDSIPSSRMSPSVEVIRIDAPTYRPNHLTIGPFFRFFKRLEELHIVSFKFF